MFKRDYFLLAMNSGLFMYKRWILEAFAITDTKTPHPYPHGLMVAEDGRYFIKMEETDGDPIEYIEDAMPGEPMFKPLEKLLLRTGDLKNVVEPVTTTYGNALVNQLVLVYPFGRKIPFMTGQIKIEVIEKIIQQRWDDEAPEDASIEAQATAPIRTTEYKRYNEAVGQLPGLSQLCVPSATRRTMTADPAMLKRRDELLEKHKHELHDQVVLAKILDELTQMDRKWMAGDPGERFYIKGKAYDVVRLKVFIMQGISTGFGEAADLITSSLDEGWDIKKLPAMINQLRDGSHSRGAQTALGGVETKFNNRIFQNSQVEAGDCGTKRGLSMLMTKEMLPHFEGNYHIRKNGEVENLTPEVLSGLEGKEVQVRSPIYCKTAGANFCAVCMGDRIASTPQALSTYAADIGSIFLSLFMAAMHGKSLKTEVLDWDAALT